MPPDRDPDGGIRRGELLVPCADLDASMRFYTRLGFRLEAIHPADEPRVAELSGHGLCLRLERGAVGAAPTVRLLVDDPAAFTGGPGELLAPDGTRVVVAAAAPPRSVPAVRPALVVTRARDCSAWQTGRAGMRYRDLLPCRLGGHVIASHIRIDDGGAVPDYVHYHEVRFQAIYCHRGWARLVYEDQGPPFVLREGDCVLQPPGIRHRVLECSHGLEVFEVASPAEHPTRVDHDMVLPTATERPDRRFAGQRFVRCTADAATWQPWRLPGFQARDLGIADATGGVVGMSVVRPADGTTSAQNPHDAAVLLLVVLEGEATLRVDGHGDEVLCAGDAVAVPAGTRHALTPASASLRLLEVALPPSA